MRWLALILLLTTAATAGAPPDSLRPIARDGTDARTPTRTPPLGAILLQPDQTEVYLSAAASATGPARALRPSLRPKAIVQRAMERRRTRARGAVCGDPDLQGAVVGAVPGRISGCGIKDAVRLRSVSGVTLSQKAVMDCKTAKALKKWTERSAKPAMSRVGGLAGYRVAAHYACRTRNNQPGAKISEHGRGRAIDISGFTLPNGQIVSVLEGWKSKRYGAALRKMHTGACGPFGTVLGPNADRFHRDHFHFDTARYRSGTYCR